ncbi:mandelate racemase/muconate lactonizing enzyme family protein [Polynucleobacter kasalickyi]|uniref:L-alanine-DL-glutamate epimerase n=1 Tax=Polynucleobacter kasalickyi TaxID=1938817 RepID=A0A1W1Y456_9BURK|nr:mandelate racemase/muconate lactonizing enzyme family protein [Polynucleobacter kasalickyi]SMC30621.1 L-alanine-DL-glutamate epimerase [Polynucleobacter kasalickyi]
MSIIESIEVMNVAVPLDKVTSFSTRTVTERHYCLVKVRNSVGVEGIGFCYVGSGAGSIARVAVEELLAPKLIGQNSHRTEGLWQEMYAEAILQGRSGSVMRGISILDNAMWDLNAQMAKLPLHEYLGAVTLDKVPAYASGGYYVDGKTPALLAKEMEAYVALGFKAVKMKTGRLSPAQEEERLAAVRDAVGEDILVTMDANNAWADLPTAMEYIKRFEQYNPYWIEEPFSPDAIDLHARLAARTSITVATGEIEVGRWRFRELIEAQGCEILQTDAAVCGGISEWRRIAAYASAKGVTVSPHWFHDLHAPLVAATPNARFVEYFTDDQVLNFRRLISRQLDFNNGDLMLHQTPGLGFHFDEVAIKKYSNGQSWVKIK